MVPTLIYGWDEQNVCVIGIDERDIAEFDLEPEWEDYGDGPELRNLRDYGFNTEGRWFKRKADAKRAATKFWRDRRDTAIYALGVIRGYKL